MLLFRSKPLGMDNADGVVIAKLHNLVHSANTPNLARKLAYLKKQKAKRTVERSLNFTKFDVR